MATVDEVDEVALALLAEPTPSSDGAAFRVAWEAWGMWANGGFEMILTSPSLADEEAGVTTSLRLVGAAAEAALFDEAFALAPSSSAEPRSRGDWELSSDTLEAARALDEGMRRLPPMIEHVLGPFLDDHPELHPRRA